ncbi:hypothetical protein V6N12_006289 [Hibiscus sabdariffa]|uniref:CLAVATA3/ESR (CLE)-related protein 25-like n=1 Tax=Hibiscus sabdariffa TaxID=183260 RepID=A0ABR2EYE9_9ROSI
MAGPATSLLFAALVVLGFTLVLSIEVLQSVGHEAKTVTTVTGWSRASATSGELQQQVEVLGKGKSSVAHPKQDLDYMSKRRVPNGPDPIHNRRAGNSGRPPGQA